MLQWVMVKMKFILAESCDIHEIDNYELCLAITDCDYCTANPRCGWCGGSERCYPGNAKYSACP
jgi:hypothetical protein